MSDAAVAILDFVNQDVGLKILFPEADYYVFKTEECTAAARAEQNTRFGGTLTPSTAVEHILAKSYRAIFIIVPLYNCVGRWNGKQKDVNPEINNYFHITIEILRAAAASARDIFFFDNSDYDYDPNLIFIQNNLYDDFVVRHGVKFFKRAYMKNKIYMENVVPFPYIAFGPQCIIDLLHSSEAATTDRTVATLEQIKQHKLFFSGALFEHNDPIYPVYRNRRDTANKIYSAIGDAFVYKNGMSHADYMKEMRQHSFCLDLLGVGDPNKRTFEILAHGTLRIAQQSNLEWGFEEGDDFPAECSFKDEHELIEKLARLKDPALYIKCLEQQNALVKKYMGRDTLRQYIIAEMTE